MKKESQMKIGEHDVTLKNGFILFWKGLIGLFLLLIIFGKWFLAFFLWFGKIFMKVGEGYEKKMDKKMKEYDKAYK